MLGYRCTSHQTAEHDHQHRSSRQPTSAVSSGSIAASISDCKPTPAEGNLSVPGLAPPKLAKGGRPGSEEQTCVDQFANDLVATSLLWLIVNQQTRRELLPLLFLGGVSILDVDHAIAIDVGVKIRACAAISGCDGV